LVQIRPAQRQDAPAIEALYRLLVPGDGNIAVDPERLAALEGDPTNHLLVAEADGSVMGTAFLTVCLDAMYGFQPYGVVENLILHPAARGQHVGAALMNELEQIARAARCTKLMLLSSQARTDAHRFFQRLGFDGERKRGFVKYLNRVPAPKPRQ
jgi:N-acetylglutamate synthase-like GNAT family acetyltransferase